MLVSVPELELALEPALVLVQVLALVLLHCGSRDSGLSVARVWLPLSYNHRWLLQQRKTPASGDNRNGDDEEIAW